MELHQVILVEDHALAVWQDFGHESNWYSKSKLEVKRDPRTWDSVTNSAEWAPFSSTGESAGAGWGCALLLRYWCKPCHIVFLWMCSNLPLKCRILYSILYSLLLLNSCLTFSQGSSLHLHLLLARGTGCCECTGHWCMLWHLKSMHGREHPQKVTFNLHRVCPFGEPWGASLWGL